MKLIIALILFIPIISQGQIYKKLQVVSHAQLAKHKNDIPSEYYGHLLKLLSARDTNYLKQQLSNTKSEKIIFIEGYNFETNKYSLFEEYIDNASINRVYHWSQSKFFLDGTPVEKMQASFFLTDTTNIYKDSSRVDTIFPRKYRYGIGCVVTDSNRKITQTLEKKAEQDGVVIEKYCKVATLFDMKSRHIFIYFTFPVAGQREFKNLGAGMLTDYPPGLDFWLFSSPYILDGETFQKKESTTQRLIQTCPQWFPQHK